MNARLLFARSVTLRLTLLFAVVSISVLLALGFTVGPLVDRHFEEMDDELLEGKIELIRHALSDPETGTLNTRLNAALVGHHGVAVSIWRSDGSVLYATANARFPPRLWQPGGAPERGLLKWSSPEGQLFRGRVRAIPPEAPGESGKIVAVSTALEMHEHFMRSFNETLWSIVAIAAIASGLLGWLAARRGLSPLRDICRDAAEITADRLNRRLPVESIPTELAEVARTLNDMLARLEDSFRRLSDFSSDLAHELRTPVSNLLTQTQVTLARTRTAGEYREVLASNAEEFERLSRMIADMLFLARADNDLVNQRMPGRSPVDLRAEAESLIEFYETLAEENGVALSLRGQAIAPGDRLMLRRAMSNLLSNALRHTPRGGHIEICLSPPPEIPGRAIVSVANTGPTIPPEHLPHLFDRFYRADPSRKREAEGSGLGLAITRSIMRAHGGEVTARSEHGLTVFELGLPCST